MKNFLARFLSEATDAAEDEAACKAAFTTLGPEGAARASAALRAAAESDDDLPLEEIGTECNHWFGTSEEARGWLLGLAGHLDAQGSSSAGGASSSTSGETPVDSNGTPLADGDSVTVIKDLKVKGGSSDLKRGTLVKKIRLTGDPEAIEARVDGSTLVLKTCFLKKA